MGREKRQVVVIGGGAAGLAATVMLKRRGIDVLLLEANDRAGGRLGGDEVDGFHIDEGADFLTSTHDAVHRIVREFGIPLSRGMRKTGTHRNGEFVVTGPMPTPLHALRYLPALRRLGFLSLSFAKALFKLRGYAADCTFSSDSRVAERDGEEGFAEHLRRLGLNEAQLTTLQGIIGSVIQDSIENVGLAYGMVYFSELRTRLHMLQVPNSGMGMIAHALSDACGDAIRLSSPVRRVEIHQGRATQVLVGDGTAIEADAVICATPVSTVLDMVPDLPCEMRRTLGRISYSAVCRVVLGLDHPALPPGWHAVSYPEDLTMPLLLERTSYLPSCAPPGKHMLDLIVGYDQAAELFPLNDDEIRGTLLREVRARAPEGSRIPTDDGVLFTRVYRWTQGICLMPPGALKAVKEMRERDDGVKNLFLAGDYMKMPSTNGAIASGEEAATAALAML